MKKILITTAAIILILISAAGIFIWKTYSSMMVMETIEYDSNLTILTGGGSNSIILKSEDGKSAIATDTKMFSGSERMRKAVKAEDITLVITHNHPDHVYGIKLFPEAKIIAGNFSRDRWDSAFSSRYPDETIKPGDEKIIKLGSETVRIKNMGHSHSTNDVIIYLEKRKMLITGDLVFLDMHPVLAEAKISNWIETLDYLYKYDIKAVVPGHGKVMDKSAIITMKEYFTSIIDALGNREKLAAVKIKYSGYEGLPGGISFNNNVQYIENEMKRIKK